MAATPPATAAASGDVRESIVARGILADSAGTVVLFAEVHRCTAEPSGQVFVSTDSGKTFSKRGPELEGCSFDLALSTPAGQLWVVGLHTAEGPGIDPFVLVPGGAPGDLVLHPVREGPAEIVGAARGRQGDLVVWLRNISVVAPTRGKRAYESRDEGVTWKESARPSTAGLTHFSRLGRRSGAWRIVDRPDGGFDIQRFNAKTWQSVVPFPWRACAQRP